LLTSLLKNSIGGSDIIHAAELVMKRDYEALMMSLDKTIIVASICVHPAISSVVKSINTRYDMSLARDEIDTEAFTLWKNQNADKLTLVKGSKEETEVNALKEMLPILEHIPNADDIQALSVLISQEVKLEEILAIKNIYEGL